jgi:hypothetical protein
MQVQRVFDLGYKGVTKDFPDLNCILPFKRGGGGRGRKGKKGEELTPEQKSFNRELSKARVVVEHTISRVKKFNIFGQEFRNRLRFYDVMTDIHSLGLDQHKDNGSRVNELPPEGRTSRRETRGEDTQSIITPKV